MTTTNRNPRESSQPKVQTTEFYTIIENFPGDLPHESHSASEYFDSYTEAKAFLDAWREQDPSVKSRRLSIASRDL